MNASNISQYFINIPSSVNSPIEIHAEDIIKDYALKINDKIILAIFIIFLVTSYML